jgi:hypothetical protein
MPPRAICTGFAVVLVVLPVHLRYPGYYTLSLNAAAWRGCFVRSPILRVIDSR